MPRPSVRLYLLEIPVPARPGSGPRSTKAGLPMRRRASQRPLPPEAEGALTDLDPEYGSRLSLCCAREGCRKRTTPPSVRFLGRRVYLGVVVVLASAMRDGITAKRTEHLRDRLGVGRRTLRRWRAWWRGAFAAGGFWKSVRGRFVPPVEVSALPASLVERFSGEDDRSRLIQAPAFVSPLTTTSAGSSRRSFSSRAMPGYGPRRSAGCVGPTCVRATSTSGSGVSRTAPRAAGAGTCRS